MPLAEGQLLDGKYVITRRIAEGATSTVYLGVNRRIGREVAVKVLDPRVVRDPDLLGRFEREARIASSVRSPHVADVYDFGELESGERFMVMEYLEGESLARLLEREQTIAPRLLATIAAQILDALAAAHAAGVVHRDLKPENVIVTTRGKGGRDVVVKVVDFGISKVVGAPKPDRAASIQRLRATAAGAVLGTPLYMSPEQARGDTDRIGPRSDLYSLGVILYEATAGEPPLTGENVNELLFRVALDEPTPLAKKVPSVDPAFAAIVAKAMAKDPAERYPSADEMREALGAWRAVYVSGALAPISLEGMATSVRAALPSAPDAIAASRSAAGASRPSAATEAIPRAASATSEVTTSDRAKPEIVAVRAAVGPRRRRRAPVVLAACLFGSLLAGGPAAWRAVRVHLPPSGVAPAPAPAASLASEPPAEAARPDPIPLASAEPPGFVDGLVVSAVEPELVFPAPARASSLAAAARPAPAASSRARRRVAVEPIERALRDAGALGRRADVEPTAHDAERASDSPHEAPSEPPAPFEEPPNEGH